MMLPTGLIVAAQRQCQLMPHLRLGQAVFNLAYLQWPKQVEELVGTDADCFYEDDLIEAFIKSLAQAVNENGSSMMETQTEPKHDRQ